MRPAPLRSEVSGVAWQTAAALVERWQRQPQPLAHLDEAAAQAGFEAPPFAKRSRQVMGALPGAYVRALGLEDPAVSITEVAEEVGHGGGASYSKALRRPVPRSRWPAWGPPRAWLRVGWMGGRRSRHRMGAP